MRHRLRAGLPRARRRSAHHRSRACPGEAPDEGSALQALRAHADDSPAGELQRALGAALGAAAEVSTSGVPFVEATAAGVDKGVGARARRRGARRAARALHRVRRQPQRRADVPPRGPRGRDGQRRRRGARARRPDARRATPRTASPSVLERAARARHARDRVPRRCCRAVAAHPDSAAAVRAAVAARRRAGGRSRGCATADLALAPRRRCSWCSCRSGCRRCAGA